MVLQAQHKEAEQQSLSKISSTMQGSAAALIEKIARNPDINNRAEKVLKGTEFATCVKDQRAWQHVLLHAKCILAEGAQGYSLGLNAGFWPYCTSRDCTPARFASDMGLPWDMIKDVIGTCRVHPIRVGNTPDGFSGGHYLDQRELDWEKDIGVAPEKTTVTKRNRRIFSWSWLQFHEAMTYCAPTQIFLNFCNYDGEQAQEIVSRIHQIYGRNVTYLGFGPRKSDIEGL
jgi:adenylosuccinate synthase